MSDNTEKLDELSDMGMRRVRESLLHVASGLDEAERVYNEYKTVLRLGVECGIAACLQKGRDVKAEKESGSDD